VKRVLFAGDRQISAIGHDKLDLALLEVTPSGFAGERRDRALRLQATMALNGGVAVVAVGYPGEWRRWVPAAVQTRNALVLDKLLDGDRGSKRLAPGESIGMIESATGPEWTACHDATTINGNSGSPLACLNGARPLGVVGLHYGGRWSSPRVNWAHVLGACLDAPVTTGQSLGSALRTHGVAL
jgi:hypothetical protein